MNKAKSQPGDLDWIKSSLQSAIELEFSTLPLYLSALFSLKVQNYTAYHTIRSVIMEEMVHMAIASNILAAIGGTPDIKNIDIRYPVKGLPGGTEPDLQIGLASFSKAQLRNFMRIEVPAFLLDDSDLPEEYPTIGVFYEGIKSAIIQNADLVRVAVKNQSISNQVGDDIGFSTFDYSEDTDPVEMLCSGIDEILEQGEGATSEDLVTTDKYEKEESHYAKFATLFYGAAFNHPGEGMKITKESEHLFFCGLPVGWPEVTNILTVPSDGYRKLLDLDPNGKQAEEALNTFDSAFTTMMTALDLVWNGPVEESINNFNKAVHQMVDFRSISCFQVMQNHVPQELVGKLKEIYPDEYDFIRNYSDLEKPLVYGPRFRNLNCIIK